ncbi:MAG TPA: NAD(P)H-dependent oxidoreductase subunit E [Acidobacteria bacterium]|nr:NAD(P)H-dependent oxidoreductase subunit E [Acidobacteriota bacterium]
MEGIPNEALERVDREFFGAQAPVMDEEVDPEAYRLVDRYVEEHPGGQEQLIPLLHRVQEFLGYLPFPVQEYIAGKLGLSPIEVYSVVSFYHFFTTTPRGRYQLKVCMGTACFVNNAQTICDVVGDLLGIRVGEVTGDRMFSLEQVRCIGACGLAPAMMVNDEVHGHLTPNAIRKLVRKLKSAARKERDRSAGEANGESEH